METRLHAGINGTVFAYEPLLEYKPMRNIYDSLRLLPSMKLFNTSSRR